MFLFPSFKNPYLGNININRHFLNPRNSMLNRPNQPLTLKPKPKLVVLNPTEMLLLILFCQNCIPINLHAQDGRNVYVSEQFDEEAGCVVSEDDVEDVHVGCGEGLVGVGTECKSGGVFILLCGISMLIV